MERFERIPSPEKKEKPAFLYHGSLSHNVTEFEPRRRFVPQGVDASPRVYATGLPAFAAAHSFPWHSGEGVELSVENDVVVLRVPEELESRLLQKVSIYTFDSTPFSITEEDTLNETYHTEESIKPKEIATFDSVIEAVERYGGRVEIVPLSAK